MCNDRKISPFHRTIGRSPCKALLSNDPKIGLTSNNIPSAFTKTLSTEEKLIDIMKEGEESLMSNSRNDSLSPQNIVGKKIRATCDKCSSVFDLPAEECIVTGPVIYSLCSMSDKISDECAKSRNKTKEAAEKMLSSAARKVGT